MFLLFSGFAYHNVHWKFLLEETKMDIFEAMFSLDSLSHQSYQYTFKFMYSQLVCKNFIGWRIFHQNWSSTFFSCDNNGVEFLQLSDTSCSVDMKAENNQRNSCGTVINDFLLTFRNMKKNSKFLGLLLVLLMIISCYSKQNLLKEKLSPGLK